MKNVKILVTSLALMLFMSCGQTESNDGSDTGEPSAPETTRTTADGQDAELFSLKKTLPIVYIDRVAFKNKLANKTLVFKFVIANNDSLSVAAWLSKSNGSGSGKEFDSLPTVTFLVGGPSDFALRKGDFIGDMTMSHNDVNTCKTFLNNATQKWVLFKPEPDEKAPNHFRYKMYLDDKEPLFGTFKANEFKAAATSFEANPSPPRNFN